MSNLETTHDWRILEDPEVQQVIGFASRKVAWKFEVDADDLAQDAGILVADLHRDLHECWVAGNLGMLQYRLDKDLVDLAREQVRKADRHTSYEKRNDESFDDGASAPRPASIAIRNSVGGYTRELVESLIPAVWDESFCWGIRVENAPDADMPRGTTNKSTGNTLAAHIADIKTGWAKAPLTLNERRALLLGYGLDWTQRDIGFNLGMSQRGVGKMLERGVGKIVACLNADLAHMFELCGTTADITDVPA